MSDKTEKPSVRRLQRARADGDIAKSTHLTVTVAGGLWWLMLTFQAPHLFASFVAMTGAIVSLDTARPFDWQLKLALSAMAEPCQTALAMLGFGTLASLVPELAQTRGLIAFKRIAPDFKRLDPIAGATRLFSLKAMFDTAFVLMQLSILLYVAWHVIATWLAQTGPSFSLGPLSQLALAAQAHGRLLALAALSQLLPAVADYAVQHVLRTRRLRMDRDELKREHRDDQGDPFVKGRRRALHRAFNEPS